MKNSPNTFGQWSGACVSRLIQLKELMRITLFWVTRISSLSALVTDISRTLDTETVVSLPDIWKLELILLGHGNMSPRILASRNIASQDKSSWNMASRNMASQNMDSWNLASINMVSQNMGSWILASRNMVSRNMVSRNMAFIVPVQKQLCQWGKEGCRMNRDKTNLSRR